MIVDHHPIARFEFLIQRPGGVCNHKLLNSGMREHAHIRGHLARRIAFVQMDAALRENHTYTRDFAERKFSCVPGDARFGQFRKLSVLNRFDRVLNDRIQARPENDRNFCLPIS